MRIGVAGKGGSGKTTLAVLIIQYLLKENKKPVLAVDADPNYCLGDFLGIENFTTLMDKAEELMRLKNSLPPGIDKTLLWEMGLEEILCEREGFDLLVMGKTEGPGCYCTANNLLRYLIERLAENYPYMVMDNEAGMEHLSRRTSKDLDHLIIVANPHPLSLKSAQRIWETAEKLEIGIKNKHLVIMETLPDSTPPATTFTPPLATIPFDKEIERRAREGIPLLGIQEDSPAFKETASLMEKIL